MRDLRIARGKRRTDPYIQNGKASWDKLAGRLLDFKITAETFAEYQAMPVDRRAAVKDVGYLVGGPFSGKTRRKSELRFRSILTFDLDHLGPGDADQIVRTYDDYEFVCYSTHSNSAERPRLRLVFPLGRDVSAVEYECIARRVADELGMDFFDDTTFEVSRIMYWPSRSKDGDQVAYHHHGDWINPDMWLWGDWEDFAAWPHSMRVLELREPGKEAADPLTKPGIIGAFCRTYDIHGAIAAFELPFEATEWDNRYFPIGATGAAGAIVYDDLFMYSHHERPEGLSNKNVNAFDLVRICKFGDYTPAEISAETRPFDTDSMKQMLALVAADPTVGKELADDELGPESPEPPPPRADVDELRGEITQAQLGSAAECDAYLFHIATYNSSEQEVLLQTLKEKYPTKMSILALRKRVKEIKTSLTGKGKDGEVRDMEIELVQEFLGEHYFEGEHLRRIARRFWTFEHGLWDIDEDERIAGRAIETVVRLRVEQPDTLMELSNMIEDTKTSTLSNMLWLMVQRHMAGRSNRDDPLHLLRRVSVPAVNCLNHEVWFEPDGSIEIREHDPEHFWTTQVATRHDPDAACPEWDRFTEMIGDRMGDPEDFIRHLEEFCGYLISPWRTLKSWGLFHGETNTGKSTLAAVLQSMLGSAYVSREMSRYGAGRSNFAEAGLIGKLLLVDDDFAKADSLPDGFLKKISEEKAMSAEIKFGGEVQFICRAFPLICSNHWPVTRDVSAAFRERALVFDFTHQISDSERSDKRFHAMLEETPGILNRLLAGLGRLYSRGGWEIPIDCAIAHDTWEKQSNQAIVFRDDVMREDPEAFCVRSSTWPAYTVWHRSVGGYALGRNELYERLDQLLGRAVKREGVFGWAGWIIGGTEELDD